MNSEFFPTGLRRSMRIIEKVQSDAPRLD